MAEVLRILDASHRVTPMKTDSQRHNTVQPRLSVPERVSVFIGGRKGIWHAPYEDGERHRLLRLAIFSGSDVPGPYWQIACQGS